MTRMTILENKKKCELKIPNSEELPWTKLLEDFANCWHQRKLLQNKSMLFCYRKSSVFIYGHLDTFSLSVNLK